MPAHFVSSEEIKIEKTYPVLRDIRKFFFEYGHAHIPDLPEFSNLFQQCQRLRSIKFMLPPEVISELESMGFYWNRRTELKEETWLSWFDRLKRFKEVNEDFSKLRAMDLSLHLWMLTQLREFDKLLNHRKKADPVIGPLSEPSG